MYGKRCLFRGVCNIEYKVVRIFILLFHLSFILKMYEKNNKLINKHIQQKTLI